jgi:hypothetical protein
MFGRALRSADGRVLATPTAHRAARYSRGRQDVSALRDSVEEDTRKDAILRFCVLVHSRRERELERSLRLRALLTTALRGYFWLPSGGGRKRGGSRG